MGLSASVFAATLPPQSFNDLPASSDQETMARMTEVEMTMLAALISDPSQGAQYDQMMAHVQTYETVLDSDEAWLLRVPAPVSDALAAIANNETAKKELVTLAATKRELAEIDDALLTRLCNVAALTKRSDATVFLYSHW